MCPSSSSRMLKKYTDFFPLIPEFIMQCVCECVCACVCHVLLWLEVSVNDTQAVKVIEGQCEFSQVKLHILLSEHHLQHTRTKCLSSSKCLNNRSEFRLDLKIYEKIIHLLINLIINRLINNNHVFGKDLDKSVLSCDLFTGRTGGTSLERRVKRSPPLRKSRIRYSFPSV